MNERVYKSMGFAGVIGIVVGILTMVMGIAVGVLSFVSAAKLLKDRKKLTI